MKYHIVEKGSFTMFGKSLEVSVVDGACFRDIPAFWERCEEDGTTLRIAQAAGYDRQVMLSSVLFGHDASGTFRYMIAGDAPGSGMLAASKFMEGVCSMSTPAEGESAEKADTRSAPSGSAIDVPGSDDLLEDTPSTAILADFEQIEIPAHTWAVFSTGEGENPELTIEIHDIWKRIHPEWFPTSGYEHAEGPDMERFRRVDGEKFIGEAWVPVVRAKRVEE